MAKQKTVVPFRGTQEQEKELIKIIEKNKDVPGALMPVLQQAQELYGYLPIEVQTKIAEGLGVSLEEVYQVVTFYGQFALNPTGKHRVAVCLGTACYVKGAQNWKSSLASRLAAPRRTACLLWKRRVALVAAVLLRLSWWTTRSMAVSSPRISRAFSPSITNARVR